MTRIEEIVGEGWIEITERYPARLSEAEGRVARWALAPENADWHSPYPFWGARDGVQPTSKEVDVPREPGGWDAVVRYGFDEDGRVAVARWYTVIMGVPRVSSEAIWTTISERPVYLYRFYPPFEDVVVSCVVPRYEHGLLRAVDAWYHDGRHATESYHYDDDRLTGIIDDDARYVLAYDDDGNLLTITCRHPEHHEGQPTVVYRRRKPGAVAAAQRTAARSLAEGVIAWARRQELAAPARLLLLGYAPPPNDPLPPALALGMVGDTTARDVESGALDRESLFTIAEQPVLDAEPAELITPVALEPFQILNQEWRSTNDPEAARKFMVSVAKRLAREDWAEILGTVAPDFAVVAVDPEREDLRKNLRALGIHDA